MLPLATITTADITEWTALGVAACGALGVVGGAFITVATKLAIQLIQALVTAHATFSQNQQQNLAAVATTMSAAAPAAPAPTMAKVDHVALAKLIAPSLVEAVTNAAAAALPPAPPAP